MDNEKKVNEYEVFADFAANNRNEQFSRKSKVKHFFRQIGRRNPLSPFSMMINTGREPDTVLSANINDRYNTMSLFLYGLIASIIVTFASFGFFLLCEFEGESVINTTNVNFVLVNSTKNSIALFVQYYLMVMFAGFAIIRFNYDENYTVKEHIRAFLPAVSLRCFVGSLVNLAIRDLYFINRLHISVSMGSARSALQIDIMLIVLCLLMDFWLSRYLSKILTVKYEFDKRYIRPGMIAATVIFIAISLLFFYFMYFSFLS